MIITERTASDAELDKVLDIIRKGALSPEGRKAISIDKLSKDKDIIDRRAERIALYISLLGGEAPDVFPPVEDLFEYADETHADFSGEDIHRAGEFLHSYISMLHFLRKDEDIHEEDRILSEDILSSLDSEGNVREDHPRLLPLIKKRDEIRNERMRFSASFISSHPHPLSPNPPSPAQRLQMYKAFCFHIVAFGVRKIPHNPQSIHKSTIFANRTSPA